MRTQSFAMFNGHGHFAAFHIQGDHLDAADVHWLPMDPDPAEGNNKDLWSNKHLSALEFKTTPNSTDGWGGWKLIK
jgi:hypothetical protein